MITKYRIEKRYDGGRYDYYLYYTLPDGKDKVIGAYSIRENYYWYYQGLNKREYTMNKKDIRRSFQQHLLDLKEGIKIIRD